MASRSLNCHRKGKQNEERTTKLDYEYPRNGGQLRHRTVICPQYSAQEAKDRRGGPIITFPARSRAAEIERSSLTRLLTYLGKFAKTDWEEGKLSLFAIDHERELGFSLVLGHARLHVALSQAYAESLYSFHRCMHGNDKL
ncbi:hypothetical protein OS493_008893 [Desmophyllum pertusum]|uniref:Uncharacterized protein n=1 Tax=Desmophyllum pertusum TaxID=174260 RepID=A0A9W9ZFD0_9CNID|nr:hypothetical protein OS493_008893 [Desmophyllum pertusum]